MKKFHLLIILVSLFNLTTAQNCNYAVELLDDYGDGWGVGNDIIVEVEGTPIDTFTLVSGSGPEGHYINANEGEIIDIIFRGNGSYPSECRIILKDCKANTIANVNESDILNTTVNCTNCMSGDCENSEQICDNTTINSNPNGSGYYDELNSSNWGTLINGEHYSNWLHFQATVDCEICLTITNTDKIDYDFAVWNSFACPPTNQPLRCSYARMSSGLPDTAYNTGMRNTDLCSWEKAHIDTCGNSADGFTKCINATAGQEFTLLIDNWDGVSSPFTLSWSINQTDALNCDEPLPVEFITSSYNCKTKTLNWAVATEKNNDFFTIKVGQSFKDGKLIVDNEYKIYGKGNSNILSNYEYYLNINNVYVQIWQTDYDGTTVLLNTNYINCKYDNHSVVIYPNPINKDSYATINNEYKIIVIYDILGNKINNHINNNKISGLNRGIYIVVIDNIHTIRLIVN